jgi:hypothetical protein
MLCGEIIAVCSQIHTKHINTVWTESRIILYVKPAYTESVAWALDLLSYRTSGQPGFDNAAIFSPSTLPITPE